MGWVAYRYGVVTIPEFESSVIPQRLNKMLHEFSTHIRNPDVNPAPSGIEDRRMEIYRDLFYQNIEGFISSAFPVLRSISTDDYWQSLVRDFMVHYRAKSPFFLQVAQEFLIYLEHFRGSQNCPEDFPFMLELAHYEWVELALDVAESDAWIAKDWPCEKVEFCRITISPLAWCLSYKYPVHLIGPNYIPQQPTEQPTQLLVYRNSDDAVGFMEINAVSAHLLQTIQGNPEMSLLDCLELLAERLSVTYNENFVDHAIALLRQLHRLDIILLD